MKPKNYDIIFNLEKDNWWYKAKRDLFYNLLNSMKRNFNLALDIGCGVGSNSEILKNFSIKTVGIDNSEKSIFFCKDKYDYLYKMDATDLKFKINSFDLVLCSDVLEHLDDSKAINEIARVLKPKGIFIFSVPAHNYLWGPTDLISNHKKRYEKNELRGLLNKNFNIIKLGYWNFLMFFPNLLFINLLASVNKNNKPQNTLQFIPKYLNNLLYNFLAIENRFFPRFNFPQGVSIIGICQKKEK